MTAFFRRTQLSQTLHSEHVNWIFFCISCSMIIPFVKLDVNWVRGMLLTKLMIRFTLLRMTTVSASTLGRSQVFISAPDTRFRLALKITMAIEKPPKCVWASGCRCNVEHTNEVVILASKDTHKTMNTVYDVYFAGQGISARLFYYCRCTLHYSMRTLEEEGERAWIEGEMRERRGWGEWMCARKGKRGCRRLVHHYER